MIIVNFFQLLVNIYENENSKIFTLSFWIIAKLIMCWISIVPLPGGSIG